MPLHIDAFRHRHPIRVRFHHVDRMNVVHNLAYFYFFEEARVEYIRALGIPVDERTFVTHDRFFIVRNACDYLAPAVFDEELVILTRIVLVGKSSMTFEHVALKADGSPAARADHVFVHVDDRSGRPARVPDRIRELIGKYEGGNVSFAEE